jgi:hypothetical protein
MVFGLVKIRQTPSERFYNALLLSDKTAGSAGAAMWRAMRLPKITAQMHPRILKRARVRISMPVGRSPGIKGRAE